MDVVFLEGLQFYGYHGVDSEERSLGQRFLVDVELTTDLRAAGQADDLTQTVNYSLVYTRVQTIVEGPPHNLIETVAEELATALLADFPASSVTVVVRKPEVGLRGATLRAAGVRIVRPAPAHVAHAHERVD